MNGWAGGWVGTQAMREGLEKERKGEGRGNRRLLRGRESD
jgi:hypothetical protein